MDRRTRADLLFSQLRATRRSVNLLFEESFITPALDKPKPKSGTYYMRYRAIDADGFEGPFTAAQRFVVDPPRVSGASNVYTTGMSKAFERVCAG